MPTAFSLSSAPPPPPPRLAVRCSSSRTNAWGLELTVVAAAAPPSDGTNYGVADVLEEKTRRGALEHLANLSTVALYSNDRQIEEVHYYYRRGEPTCYEVRIWVLDATD
jgi:hypothetical protein